MLGNERSLPARASDGAARFERTHFVSAPHEAATEPAADPQQRQERVTQHPRGGRFEAQMPAGRARERGFGAVPDGRERDNAAQRQVQRRNHIRGRRERAETTGQNLQRIVLPKRGLPQLRPPPLTRPYFARGAVAEGCSNGAPTRRTRSPKSRTSLVVAASSAASAASNRMPPASSIRLRR